MIDVSPSQFEIILKILNKHVPECEVRAFGSRVTWTAKDYSDLDLVIVGKEKLPNGTMYALKEAFEESDLSFRVDVIDWHRISDEFKTIINKEYVVLKKRETKFKQTEIGMIPEDWGFEAISETCKITLGGTPKTEIKDFWGGKISWASARDVSNCKSRYVTDTERTITEKGVESSNAKIHPKNTIVITSRGTVGAIALLSEPMTFNQTCYGLQIRKEQDTMFIYYALKNSINRLKSVSYGTVFETITTKTFNEVKLPLPSLSEQSAIAKILSDLDSKIELNQQMNKTLEEIGQAIFKHWFIDFEFPVQQHPVETQDFASQSNNASVETQDFASQSNNASVETQDFASLQKGYKSSGGVMVDSELGKIPKGWKVGSIGNVATIKGGSTPSTEKPEYWKDGTYYWCTPKDLSKLHSLVLLNTERKITEKGLSVISSGVLPKGTVLLSSRAPIGYLAISEIPVSINQGFIAIFCDKEITNYFMFYWIKFNLDIIKNMASGSTFQEINKATFRSIKILIPPKYIVQRYDIIIEKIHNKIVINEVQIQTLSQIRDSLLPKLMSGKIRVPVE